MQLLSKIAININIPETTNEAAIEDILNYGGALEQIKDAVHQYAAELVAELLPAGSSITYDNDWSQRL